MDGKVRFSKPLTLEELGINLTSKQTILAQDEGCKDGKVILWNLPDWEKWLFLTKTKWNVRRVKQFHQMAKQPIIFPSINFLAKHLLAAHSV